MLDEEKNVFLKVLYNQVVHQTIKYSVWGSYIKKGLLEAKAVMWFMSTVVSMIIL